MFAYLILILNFSFLSKKGTTGNKILFIKNVAKLMDQLQWLLNALLVQIFCIFVLLFHHLLFQERLTQLHIGTIGNLVFRNAESSLGVQLTPWIT